MRPIEEQTILITGATDGLGRGVATDLAERGATVLVHGRDDRRRADTIEEIRSGTGNDSSAVPRRLRLAGAGSRLAARVDDEHERLDVLVNNAGIGTALPGDGERMESRDGYELRFAVNYLAGVPAHPPAGAADGALGAGPNRQRRSAGQAPIDFDDVMLERAYDGLQAYCQSKLAQVMFTFDLAESCARRGHGQLPAPVHLHADQDGPRRGRQPGQLARGRACGRPLRLIADPELDRPPASTSTASTSPPPTPRPTTKTPAAG